MTCGRLVITMTSKVRQPSPDAMDRAAEWLSFYDQDTEEYAEMVEVATWLRYMAQEKFVRDAARKAGLPTAAVRRRLKEVEKRG